MKYAAPVLPAEPVNGLTCGIDWARDDHAIAIVDNRGALVHRSTVEHSSAGLREMLAALARAGAGEVAIERPDGPVVDALFHTHDLRDVILVGHSYGGMVITAIAGEIPDRIAHLIYLDAMAPHDGEAVARHHSPHRQ